MWTYDGAWHRLAAADLSIAILESSSPTFEHVTDVEVTGSGAQWSATFMTPEHIRGCLTPLGGDW
jgi:hypothetical protein